jgi:hypothetical protein
MTVEELRTVVEAASQGRLQFWELMAAVLLSTMGAFFGAYLRRKAEDRAAQENFDSLREQLRRTTHDAEEIKTALSRKSWLTRRQWAIREQHYMSLLSNLTKLKLSLEDRSSYYIQPGSEHDQARSEGEHFQNLSRVGYDSYQAIRELIGPASVFLSAGAIAALENLVREQWHVSEFSSCTAEYVEDSLKLVDAAHSAVLREAQVELASFRSSS